MTMRLPKWHRELDIFDKIKPILILEGNVLDSYQYPVDGTPGKGSILRLEQYLHFHYLDAGYGCITFYDAIRGFTNDSAPEHLQIFAEMTGASVADGHIAADFKGRMAAAPGYIRTAMTQSETPAVTILNFASRYITSPDNMEQSEVDAFTVLMQSALEAREVRTDSGVKRNLVILIVGKVNDLPAWFYLGNPKVKHILLQPPTREERADMLEGSRFRSFFDRDVWAAESPYYEEHPEEIGKLRERFVGMTDGFSLTELNGLRRLARDQRVHVRDLCSVVDLYRFGIRENPWDALDKDAMKHAGDAFRRRVKGQEGAITKTMDVIKRAMMGMSGLQGSSGTRPKGVLFFAGPTGTGKTETAKTLAEIIFGDERSCIRFDMSEYGQPHSDQKLLGAPPGYVGYESGGQLTNAVRENPFSILLFDEIEKAHPSILDKFLQILEDGRMTDGQGNTVYFTETIIIFTSNLGIYDVDRDGVRHLRVSREMPYPQVQRQVRRGIEDYFKLRLGRPEILNRIGENIVVFDFIREEAADAILAAQVEKIVRRLQEERGIALELSDEAMLTFREKAHENLDNGGRGIGNIVESLLIDPLARCLFDQDAAPGMTARISSIHAEAQPCFLDCTLE